MTNSARHNEAALRLSQANADVQRIVDERFGFSTGSDPRSLDEALDTIQELKDRIALLTDDHSYRWLHPTLSVYQAKVAWFLYSRKQAVSLAEVREFIYAHDPDGGALASTVATFLWRIRRKMPPRSIKTVQRKYYLMTAVGREWIRNTIERGRASLEVNTTSRR